MLPAAPGTVSPFSDVIVAAPLSARAGMLGSRCREPRPPRSAHVRSRENRARRAVRRTVLHRRADDADLLPADLPGEAGPGPQRRLLSHRGRRRARGPPPPPASPPAAAARAPDGAGVGAGGRAPAPTPRAR